MNAGKFVLISDMKKNIYIYVFLAATDVIYTLVRQRTAALVLT